MRIKVIRPSLICLLVFLAPIFLYAQLYTVSRYADDSGLPSRIVHDLIQDKQGFIWVAGNNGLFKFDGRKFTPYLAALKDTIGLRDNKINVVHQTRDNRIWIGTTKGLHLLDNETISYIKIHKDPKEDQEHVLDIFEDSEDNLWISTYGGLFLKEKDRDLIQFISELEDAILPEEVIWSVTEDRFGKIWISTNNGPYTLDLSEPGKFRPIITRQHSSVDLENTKMFRFTPYNDSLMLVDSNQGLLRAVRRGEDLVEISRLKDLKGNYLPQYHINKSIVGKDGSIWAGTAKNSYFKYKLATNGRLEPLMVSSRNGELDITENIRSIYEDQQNNIWMANSNGLFKFSPSSEDFFAFPPHHKDNCLPELTGIYAMAEDRWGYLWINTPFKLYRISKIDVLQGNCPDEYLVFENEHMHLSRNLTIDSEDRLWIGADNGLFVTRLNGHNKPGRFRRFTTADGLPHNWSFDVLEIDHNTFWVGNYAGLVKLHLRGGDLNSPEIQVFTADKGRTDALVNSQVNELAWDKSGHLWIGTYSGLSRLINDAGEGTFVNYTSSYGDFNSLSNNSIKKILKDSRDRMWIATQRGLNLYLPEEDNFIQFGKDEGLPSEYILGIQEDSSGHFLIGTTNGVLKVAYEDGEEQLSAIEHYTSKSGLSDNIPYRNSILILENNRYLIGSREGISVRTDQVKEKGGQVFNLALTAIESTEKRKSGFNSIADRIENGSLELEHFENSIRINYAALDFTDTEYNSYRHKILPVSDQWIETGNDSELAYYNLSPGTYELLLDGMNSAGQRAEPIRLSFRINPPFWKSNWAIFGYFLLLIVLLRGLYLYRLRQKMGELDRKTALEKALLMEREQLRKENAADFHDELGSKVTKISLFLTLAERSLQESGDAQQWLTKIRENVRALSGGFRDLLWVIDPHKDSLTDTFLRLKDFGEDLFDNSDINFRVDGLENIPEERQLDAKTKKQVVLIFKEAMNNCLKYSDCTRADLSFKSNGTYSTIELVDNGKGFHPEESSEGRGLKNMYARTAQIGAQLQVVSSEKGTAVRLERIPHMGDR